MPSTRSGGMIRDSSNLPSRLGVTKKGTTIPSTAHRVKRWPYNYKGVGGGNGKVNSPLQEQ